MSARALFLTAGFGEGHNAAARALAAACEEQHGPGSGRVVDIFERARPALNRLSRRFYLGLINRAPWTWRLAYRWLDQSSHVAWVFAGLAAERRQLAELIAREQPAVLCSTYPVYAFLLRRIAHAAAARAAGGATASPAWPVHYNVVTDSISINALWWRAGGCAAWFVPNADTAAVMQARGLAPDHIRPLGFPVALFFANQHGRLAPPALGGGARPRVLYIINSGTRGAEETALKLFAEEGWDISCAVGRDERLRARLAAAGARRRHPASVLRWTNEIPRLLMTHHVVVSKAGGATTQEAIAACCPMLVNQIVPGQEEGNYELLRRHGIGALAETPDGIVEGLRFAFGNGAAQWQAWRTAVGELARPNAARDIIRAMSPCTRGPADATSRFALQIP